MPEARGRLRVPIALVRVSLLTAMQYRSNFVFNGMTGLIRVLSAIAPLWLVYSHEDVVRGWSFPEAVLVMALFLLLEALHGGLMEPNLGAIVEHVRLGTLDLVLLKPADAQLLVSMSRVDPAHLWDLAGAVVLAIWAASTLGAPAPVDVAIALLFVGCGLTAMYALWLLAICLSFFFVRVDNLRFLLTSISDAGRWPLAVFPSWARWILTLVVPVGIVTTFPAAAVRGSWTPAMVAIACGTAIAFLAISRWAWKRSLAFYTSASS